VTQGVAVMRRAGGVDDVFVRSSVRSWGRDVTLCERGAILRTVRPR
jgi:hypothetical protein